MYRLLLIELIGITKKANRMKLFLLIAECEPTCDIQDAELLLR